MIAKFTTKLKDGTPTHFVPKILTGYLSAGLITTEEHKALLEAAQAAGVAEKVVPQNLRPKIHTMREFKGKERWRVGLDFQPATGPMYGPKFKFAPAVPVVSVQEIVVGYSPAVPILTIKVDGVVLDKWEMRRLIFNDGFETVEDFKDWFFPGGCDKYASWTGRLIHYTLQTYGKRQAQDNQQTARRDLFGNDLSEAPLDNKFFNGNGEDGQHYWITPPDMMDELIDKFGIDFDPCPYPKPEGFDGLTAEWGQSNYCNPPFGSILHQGPGDRKPKKKGPTAWARKAIEENEKGKRVVLVYPIDKWILMLIEAGAKVSNRGDVKWLSTEDGTPGNGTGRHIAQFVLEPKNLNR